MNDNYRKIAACAVALAADPGPATADAFDEVALHTIGDRWELPNGLITKSGVRALAAWLAWAKADATTQGSGARARQRAYNEGARQRIEATRRQVEAEDGAK